MSTTDDTPKTTTEHEDAMVARANATTATPVVFVHGLWLLPSSWERWVTLFEEAGFVALTPGWPDDPETVEEAKEHPEVFAGKGIEQIADHQQEIIRRLERKPVVIGHSFGGLLTEILAGRGLAAASVAISPAPSRGVLPLPLSALRVASIALRNPANWNRAVPLTFEQFTYGFANVLDEDEAKQLYESYSVAGPGKTAVPGGRRQRQPVVRGEGRHEEPRAWADADHLRRQRPHRPVGGRRSGLQAPVPQRGRHRGRQARGPRPRADDRPRLAGGRRDRAGVRQAVRQLRRRAGARARRATG